MPKHEHKIISKPIKETSKILIILGGTVVALLIFWFGYKLVFNSKKTAPLAFLQSSNTNSLTTPSPKLPQEDSSNFNVPSAEIDSDQDGLSDAMETLYKTDPTNPDTDGDSYKDGDEVSNGYDPLIKSPNDKINRASTDTKTSVSPLPSPPTFTQQFVNKTGIVPTKDNLLAKEAEVNKFINETNARGVLPIILDSDIKIVNTTGKTAITKYLDTLSIVKNTKLKAVTPEQITAAFALMTKKNDPAQLTKIISSLENNATIFRAVDVPKEVVEMHKKYLSAVLALLDNTRMLKNYKADYVSALVAASRLEGLKPVFSEVEVEITALEKKYGIK